MGNAETASGGRKLLMIGLVGFAVVSVIAAFAPTAEALIASRALLGVAGATLMPSTLSLIRNTFLMRANELGRSPCGVRWPPLVVD